MPLEIRGFLELTVKVILQAFEQTTRLLAASPDLDAQRRDRSGMQGGYKTLHTLLGRLEDECVQWYAEATAVFPAGTTNGDLIRGQIPTSYSPAAATPVTPATPA